MTVEIEGGSSIEHYRTGLFSLDVALSNHGELGMPLPTSLELYGSQEVGKSTLAYYLAGTLSKGGVSILDLDGSDRNYVKAAFERSGFNGKVKLISPMGGKKKEMRLHSDCLNELGRDMENPKYTAGILDSVSAYVPNAEAESEIGDADVGRRAKDMAKFARMVVRGFSSKPDPSLCIIVNHAYAVIGGRGSQTAGGDAIKFLSGVRLRVWTDEVISSRDKTHVLAFVVRGKVEKLRYGGKGREFKYVILPQMGVSRELSALFDCFDLGMANRGTVITITGFPDENYGYLSKMIEAAREGDVNKFEPFQALLREYEGRYLIENKRYLGDEPDGISASG